MRGLTDPCARRAHFFLPQGEALSAPHSLFPREKRTGRLAVQEKSARGSEDECPTGRCNVPPGPPPGWVRALSASPVKHPATHFGYAARGCGGGRVPRSKAPPRPGESGEWPGAHRVEFGNENTRPPSFVPEVGGGAAPSAGGRNRERVLPPKRSRGGSGARRIAPAAFGDFWPVKSRAPAPARGGNPARSRGLIRGQRPISPSVGYADSSLVRGRQDAASEKQAEPMDPIPQSALRRPAPFTQGGLIRSRLSAE